MPQQEQQQLEMAAKSKALWHSMTKELVQKNPDLKKLTSSGEMIKLNKIQLEETVYGQSRACSEVARALVRADGGLTSPDRPQFVGMFLGAPGCGKTEMGKAIARIQNRAEPAKALLVIDCNGFQDDIDVHKISGSTPGYVGYGDKGLITAEFLSRPNVIVFDEIEKAHRKLHRLLLGIMDRGRLTVPVGKSTYQDVKNVDLDFSKSKIIFTSNVGSQEIRDSQKKRRVGFATPNISSTNEAAYKIGIAAMKESWQHMPEFLNRLDAVVVFEFLSLPVYKQIFNKFVDECNQNQPAGHRNSLAITQELRDWIISKTDPDNGGRELRRTLEKYVITPFAELKADLDAGVPVVADLSDDEKVEFWASEKLMAEARDKARHKVIVPQPVVRQLNDSNHDGNANNFPADPRTWEKMRHKKNGRRRHHKHNRFPPFTR